MSLHPQRSEYIARINRVIDFVEHHFSEELTLDKLAKVANFSPFHFHRIFRALVGETPNGYVQRIRVEKAASQLINNPVKSITAIALDCGFSGSAPFARVFRESFGMSASQWRAAGNLPESRIGTTDSKHGQPISKIRSDFNLSSIYFDPVNNNQSWRITMNERCSPR
ncbi:MAG: helix-turn-helix transcriptional regulator [Candidatus Delongbacteria bacterium]|nr:helix-turn-helix transcriptional regulator [Candidatus Delongbacteria bacterium]